MENQQISSSVLSESIEDNKSRDSSYVYPNASFSKVTFRKKEKSKSSRNKMPKIIEESYDILDECVKNVNCAEDQFNKISHEQSFSENKNKEYKKIPKESDKIILDSDCFISSEEKRKKKKSIKKMKNNFETEHLCDNVNKMVADETIPVNPHNSLFTESKKRRKAKRHKINKIQDLNVDGDKPEHGDSIAFKEIETEFHHNYDVELAPRHKKKHKKKHVSIFENERDQLHENLLRVKDFSVSPSTSINTDKEVGSQENMVLCGDNSHLGRRKKKFKHKHELIESNCYNISRNNNEEGTMSSNDLNSINYKNVIGKERKIVESCLDSNEIDQKNKVEDKIMELTSKKEKKRNKHKININKDVDCFQSNFSQNNSSKVVEQKECHNSDEGYFEVRPSVSCVETQNPLKKHKKKKHKKNKDLASEHSFLETETLQQCNTSKEKIREMKDKQPKKHKCDADETGLNITEGDVIQSKKRKAVSEDIRDISRFELSSSSKDNETVRGTSFIEFDVFHDSENKNEVSVKLAKVSQNRQEKDEHQRKAVSKNSTSPKSETTKHKNLEINSRERESNTNHNTSPNFSKSKSTESTTNPENQNEEDSTEKIQDVKFKKKRQHCDENVISKHKQKTLMKPDLELITMQMLKNALRSSKKPLRSSKSLSRKSISKSIKKYNTKEEFKGLFEPKVKGRSGDFLDKTNTRAKKKRKKTKLANEIDNLTQVMIAKALKNASKSTETHIPHVTDSSESDCENLVLKTVESSNSKTKFKHHKQSPHADHEKLDITKLQQTLISTALQNISGSSPVKGLSHSSNLTQLTTEEPKMKKKAPTGRDDLEKSIHHSKKKKVKTKDDIEDVTSRLLSAALAKANV